MNKRFTIILAMLIVVFAGLLLLNKREANAPENGSDAKAQPTNHKVGAGTTGVTLTEYGDFQCPACAEYYPLVKQIKQLYGDKITFQFRHFPIQSNHPYALLAARAAEAAGMQGKFFEMHDLLYENQTTWSPSSNPTEYFDGYAKQLGLNVKKFKEDMRADSTNRTVQADLAEATRKKFDSTPTFEINGKKIQTPRDVAGFQKLIDEALKKSDQQ
jgi:protein-disulfide isomerase